MAVLVWWVYEKQDLFGDSFYRTIGMPERDVGEALRHPMSFLGSGKEADTASATSQIDPEKQGEQQQSEGETA